MRLVPRPRLAGTGAERWESSRKLGARLLLAWPDVQVPTMGPPWVQIHRSISVLGATEHRLRISVTKKPQIYHQVHVWTARFRVLSLLCRVAEELWETRSWIKYSARERTPPRRGTETEPAECNSGVQRFCDLALTLCVERDVWLTKQQWPGSISKCQHWKQQHFLSHCTAHSWEIRRLTRNCCRRKWEMWHEAWCCEIWIRPRERHEWMATNYRFRPWQHFTTVRLPFGFRQHSTWASERLSLAFSSDSEEGFFTSLL